jgi:hypothetical protein
MAVWHVRDTAIEPDACELPIPLGRGPRQAERVGAFLKRETAEESQFDQAALSGIERRKLRQRRVEVEDVHIRRVALRGSFVEYHACPPTGPFVCVAPPGMVNQDATHHLGRQREEVRPILPGGVALANQPQIGLIDERGGLKDVARRFMAKSGGCPTAQFLVDHCHQLVARPEVPAAPSVQQTGHIAVGMVQIGHKCGRFWPRGFAQSRHA